ncbi:MAG TPA: protein kinase, partial [Acidobacteriota bacterium]
MSLKKGTSLGHYETLGILGAGGMGEVYRARDTKLGREVAIKVLPADVASDPLRLARLEREARVLASLGHPHIATLYGYETAGTTRFLVMELVDGKTLLERLRRGPLPLAEALQAGAQIAAALDRAHRRGIVHRDLKPANVMLTRDGVKVLDFGLAKPLAPVTVDGEGPTMATAMTQPGSFVGTLPYMAPEQLEGKVVDTRADIFALGVLLYEMITGRRPFDGANQASLIAAILTTQPAPIAQHVAAAPEGLDWLVQRCLAADPEERWQAANDIRLHLQRIAATRAAGGAGATGEDASGAVAGAAGGSWRTALGWVAAAALALVLAMLVLSPDGPGTADLEGGSRRPLQRLLIDPGAAVVDAAVLSSDGTKLAYLAGDTPYALDVYVHSLASLQPRLLEGTRGAEVLAFSPDGAALAFTTAGELYKIAVAGGTPESLATNVMPWSISWQEDGFLYYSSEDRLWRVPQGSGEAQPLGVADAARDADYDARLLPQTRTLLFGTVSWSAPHPDNRDLVLLDLDGGRSRSLSITGVTGRFMPPRFLLFSRGRVIYGTSLDPASGQLGSPPRALEFEVQRTPRYVAEIALFDTSASGDLAFVLDESADMKELVWVERDGTPRPVTSDRRDYALASL